jgi:hypothetical protein
MHLIPGFSLCTRKSSARHGAQAHAPNRFNGAPQQLCEQIGAEELLSAGLLAALLSPERCTSKQRGHRIGGTTWLHTHT